MTITKKYNYARNGKSLGAPRAGICEVSDSVHRQTCHVLRSGFRLVSCEEPGVTEAFRDLAPEKAEWMDRYGGIVAFRLTTRAKEAAAGLRRTLGCRWVLWTADGTYVGYSAVEIAAADVLRRYPEFDSKAAGGIDEIQGAT